MFVFKIEIVKIPKISVVKDTLQFLTLLKESKAAHQPQPV